jgi:hypothetical protein
MPIGWLAGVFQVMWKAILGVATLYGLYGVASMLVLIYQVLFTGVRSEAPGLLFGVIGPLAIGYGLVARRNWARVLALGVAALVGTGGVIGGIIGIGHSAGFFQNASGLLIDRPAVGMSLVVLLLAFALVQWWILTRPDVLRGFRSSTR